MGRKVRRVPVDFDWPLREVWHGFLLPGKLHEVECSDCKNGYSPRGAYLRDLWYGYVSFRPEDNGLPPLTPETPGVRELAERNVHYAPDYYGYGEAAVVREARRLCDLFNGMWMHHITDEDVAALVEAGRLMDFTHTWSREARWQPKKPPFVPTAEQVNEWSLHGLGHDSINASVCVHARCKREGVASVCQTCQGHATVERYQGQRAEAEAWEPAEPPEGDGWQLWETVSEGSPISPVFATAEELASWMSDPERGRDWVPAEAAAKFVKAGWAPSFVGVPGRGLASGVEFVGWAADADA